MADAWRYSEVEDFQHVSIGGKTSLLRLSAVPSPRAGADGPRPMLVADDGESVFRYVAIPAPPDTGELLRAAYSVPASLITRDTVFSLEFDDGHVVSLPDPSTGAARVNRRGGEPVPAPESVSETPSASRAAEDAVTPEAPAAAEPPVGPDGEDRRTDMPRQVTALSAELGDARRENSELRALAERSLAAGRDVREALLHLHVVHAESSADLTATRDLAQALAGSDGDSGGARISELQRQLAEAHGARDEALAARREAEDSVKPHQQARERAERALAQLQEETRIMSLDREESDRQASALDGVAVKARERATEAEAEAQRAASRLGELETWSAELERRLAEATTQLADSRAREESDEADLRRLRGELAEAHAQAELDRAALDRAGVSSQPAGTAPPAGDEAAPAEPSPVPPAASQATTLREIGDAAVAEAHSLAERDLAEHRG